MTDRILTTHTGSLPRSPELTRLLVARDQGHDIDVDALRAETDRVLAHTVEQQLTTGLDVVNDGEVPRVGFSTYIRDRIDGFGGVGHRKPTLDSIKFPEYAAFQARQIDEGAEFARVWDTPLAQGLLHYDEERAGVRSDLDAFERELARNAEAGRRPAGTFVSAATPGIVATTLLLDEANPHYGDHREYVFALAEELRVEYEEIVARGHTLQLDAPDLAMERVIHFGDATLDEFLAAVDLHVEAINRALRNIPKDRVRLHVCWGNWQGPHQDDVPVDELLEHLYRAEVGAFSIPFGNPAHQHELPAFRQHPLPDDALLIPGVIDVTTNYLEHPQVVANRIVEAAEAVGDPARVIAGTDCGLATFASYEFVATDVAWAKLGALVEGAAIASRRLFG
ncbi:MULTISPECIES: methionine synthase [unclassified Curtobacterium]|uniref:methionine synthase n=1 Tax=unclassified Curtobacterium TaxID=257496 RepID=UPI000DA8BA68|nr:MULTISPECIES: methionine synthase [unclassified Curtobacterium]PZE27408.1 methionine synthase [Curtobacterium sp. MCBD17_028]PZE76230.1 methionine synthase [Curtobacterium sp. MCBD17_019]